MTDQPETSAVAETSAQPETPAATEPAAEPGTPGATAPPAGLPPGAVQVRLRRAPRYRQFLLTGGALGALAGLLLGGLVGSPVAGFSSPAVIGYFGAIGLLLGAVVGAGAAVLVERVRG